MQTESSSRSACAPHVRDRTDVMGARFRAPERRRRVHAAAMTDRVLPEVSATALDGPTYIFAGPALGSVPRDRHRARYCRVRLTTSPIDDWARAVAATEPLPAAEVTARGKDGPAGVGRALALEISLAPFWLRWSMDGQPLTSDHPHLAYTRPGRMDPAHDDEGAPGRLFRPRRSERRPQSSPSAVPAGAHRRVRVRRGMV